MAKEKATKGSLINLAHAHLSSRLIPDENKENERITLRINKLYRGLGISEMNRIVAQSIASSSSITGAKHLKMGSATPALDLRHPLDMMFYIRQA